MLKAELAKKLKYAMDTDETQVLDAPSPLIEQRKQHKKKKQETAEEETTTEDETVEPVDLHDDQAEYLIATLVQKMKEANPLPVDKLPVPEEAPEAASSSVAGTSGCPAAAPQAQPAPPDKNAFDAELRKGPTSRPSEPTRPKPSSAKVRPSKAPQKGANIPGPEVEDVLPPAPSDKEEERSEGSEDDKQHHKASWVSFLVPSAVKK